MKRLRPFFLAATALVIPFPALILSGASWRIATVFAALWFVTCTVITFGPMPSFAVLVAYIVAPFVLGAVAAPFALHAARRTQGLSRRWFRRWYALPLWLALTAGLVPTTWLDGTSFPATITSAAMEPTLRNGERVVVDRLDNPATTVLRRGEIVTFRRSGGQWARRLVGLPGDRVEMRAGHLILNGDAVRREFVGRYVFEDRRITARLFRETLPGVDGRLGVSHQTLDEHDVGAFDNTAEFHVPEGHGFVMGDNRDNGLDSRAMRVVGFIPLRDLTGRARFIVWSPGNGRVGTQLD